MSDVDDFLEHYGVKGMHWGQRKAGSSKTKSKPSIDSRAATKAKEKAKVGGHQTLSNKELKLLIARMNLEKQYSTLNPTPAKKTKKFVGDFLLGVGKQQAGKVANDAAGKQIAKLIGSIAAAQAGRHVTKKVLAIGA